MPRPIRILTAHTAVVDSVAYAALFEFPFTNTIVFELDAMACRADSTVIIGVAMEKSLVLFPIRLLTVHTAVVDSLACALLELQFTTNQLVFELADLACRADPKHIVIRCFFELLPGRVARLGVIRNIYLPSVAHKRMPLWLTTLGEPALTHGVRRIPTSIEEPAPAECTEVHISRHDGTMDVAHRHRWLVFDALAVRRRHGDTKTTNL